MIKWNWYGMWVIDWLCCSCAWESYDIWEKAYLAEFPELSEQLEERWLKGEIDSITIELIENHYNESLVVVNNFILIKIYYLLLKFASPLTKYVRWQKWQKYLAEFLKNYKES